MKKRVVLVHPKTRRNRSITYPLSSLALAAALEKENFVPVIIDMEVEENYLDLLTSHLDEALFVGISSMTDWQIKYGLELCDFVRGHDPNLPIVWGGWHPTSLPIQTVQDDRVDIVVRGEGDFVVVELGRALQGQISLADVKGITYKMGRTILNNADADPIPDLNVLPYTPWHMIDIQTCIKKYGERTLCVQTGRGCPYNCTFCSHKVMPNRTPRAFSAQYIFDNIEQVIHEFDINHVRFYEPAFISSPKRVREICKEIQRRKLSILWEGSARANVAAGLDDSLFTMLRQSGCVQLNLGFESGSQRVLDSINKKTTIQESLQAVTKCADRDIGVEGYFVRGFPSERFLDMLDTDKMILEIKRLAPWSKLSMGFYTAYPGTPMYRECVDKYGLKEETTLQEWGEMSTWVNDRPWLSKTRKLWEHMVNRATHYRLTRTILYLSLSYLRSLFLFVNQLEKKWHELVCAMQPNKKWR